MITNFDFNTLPLREKLWRIQYPVYAVPEVIDNGKLKQELVPAALDMADELREYLEMFDCASDKKERAEILGNAYRRVESDYPELLCFVTTDAKPIEIWE